MPKACTYSQNCTNLKGIYLVNGYRQDIGVYKNKSSPISTMIEDSEPKGINL